MISESGYEQFVDYCNTLIEQQVEQGVKGSPDVRIDCFERIGSKTRRT